jgi:Tol biopolymer transport system component
MLVGLLIALALLIVAAPPAGATYPGGNGDLLITELNHSHGFDNAAWLVRINPTTGALSRTQICAQSSTSTFPGPRCFSVGPPAASPDGRWVAFAGADVIGEPPYPGPPPPWSIRVLPLDTGDRRHVLLDGRTLAFESIVRWTPTLDFVVQAAHGRVLLAGPDGSDRGTLLSLAAAPDVSSDGRLAVVRGDSDSLYLLKPGGKPRRLTRRAAYQPSWSPHGRRIAFTRNDWIYTVSARGGHARRLTRGFHPVWSPDGKQIAFFREVRSPAYGLKTTYLFALDRGTGRVRVVSSEVLAVHDGFQPSGLDWQATR